MELGSYTDDERMMLMPYSKFKLPIRAGNNQPPPPPAVPRDHVPSHDHLGHFAKMMLNSTDIAFRCKRVLLFGLFRLIADMHQTPLRPVLTMLASPRKPLLGIRIKKRMRSTNLSHRPLVTRANRQATSLS